MAIHAPNPITLTAVQDTAIKAAIASVNTSIAVLPQVDLNNDAKKSLNTINDIRWPYAQRTVQIHITNFPQVIPNFLTAADVRSNFDVMTKIRDYKASMFRIIEALDEVSQISENNTFEFMTAMYENAERAQKAGTVPGIQSFIDDIAPLFVKEPALPPVTPPTE